MTEDGAPAEQLLTGGRSRAGVVRTGTTVRRPQTARSPFVHAVLRRLEAAGVEGVPRFLGIDEQDREILTFLDGETGAVEHWSDALLVELALLTRAIHDALAGTPEAGPAETVCHNDLAPWNTIISGGLLVGFIDFDDAAPGSRADDLAYLLWVFLGLGTGSPYEQGHRMRLVCDAYDHPAVPGSLLAALEWQQQRILAFRASRTDAFSALKHRETLESIRWTRQHHDVLSAALVGEQS